MNCLMVEGPKQPSASSPLAALEVFDRIHQRPTVGLPVGGESGIRRQVTHEPQKTD